MRELDRRTTIKGIGATAALVGVSGLATGQDDDDEQENDDADEPDYGDWFDGVDDYEETVDETGEDEVVVAVGEGDRGFQFEPAAVRVSEGTTVVWEWTGRGGRHNVVHDPEAEEEELEDHEDDEDDESGDEDDEPEFESDLVDEDGHTFEHEFEDEGTYLYVCTPHRNVGMRGAVVVDDDGDGDDED